jgi:hypothetical protein
VLQDTYAHAIAEFEDAGQIDAEDEIYKARARVKARDGLMSDSCCTGPELADDGRISVEHG